MMEFEVFDLKRIFLGDTPLLFLGEIVFRTVIMYSYSILLIRVLGKRGMGQFSGLEVAIIICFGSAVGDPMIGADIPISYGIVAITTVAVLQIAMEKIINRSAKLERLVEGESRIVVNNGLILFKVLEKENISHEDLYRSLRGKDVEHLGQIKRAFFETSGIITVWLHNYENIGPGMIILPECEIADSAIYNKGDVCSSEGYTSCRKCGFTVYCNVGTVVEQCPCCESVLWLNNSLCGLQVKH